MWCLLLLLPGTHPLDVCMLDVVAMAYLCCQPWRLLDLLGLPLLNVCVA